MQSIFHRKLKGLVLAVALTAAVGGVAAQNFVFNWNPRSGDVWVDTRLNDINQYGYRYREPFIDEVVRYYAAPRPLIQDLIVNRRWAPGDVYYACSIAQIIGRPCQYVVSEWERDHGQGWGALAKRLGIKPGSAEFHRLKRGFVPTYDRWGRPIVIDDDLRKHYTNRGHDSKAIAKRHEGKSKSGKGSGNGHADSGKHSDYNKSHKDAGQAAKSGKAGKSDHGSGKSAKGKGGNKSKGGGKGNGKS